MYQFVNILLHLLEICAIQKFISIKNGIVWKRANLQSKLIDSFIYMIHVFTERNFQIYYSISWITRSFFQSQSLFLSVLTFTMRRSMPIFVTIFFIAGISATNFLNSCLVLFFSVLMKLFKCFLIKEFSFSVNANRFLTGKFETRLQGNLVISDNFLRWIRPKIKTDYLYWLNNEQNLKIFSTLLGCLVPISGFLLDQSSSLRFPY